MTQQTTEPRFGAWAPVYGTWGARSHPTDVLDASYHRNRDVVVAAEQAGFDSVLLAQHTVSPQQRELDVLETWTACAAIAEATERIEIIAAIKPLLYHPGVLAKMALGIDDISRGRFAINLVSAWFKPEMGALGIAMPDHDDRYVYSDEWLDVVRPLLRGETLDHDGPNFRTEDLQLFPPPVHPDGPTVYFGGESEPARQLAARAADVFFINGRPLEDTAALIADLRRRPRTLDPLRFGLSAFVIAREDEDEALAEFEELKGYAAQDDRTRLVAGTDKDVAMMKVGAGIPRVGTNGGTLAGLVGSYDQVARRIADFHAAGIELFMCQFQPLEDELERFGAELIPRVRALTPSPA
jgi:alkanesulfonate monooxygenase